MRSFSLEDYNKLTVFESDFRKAVDSRYARSFTRSEFDVINQVYYQTLNRNANMSCGGCVLQMLTSVGRLYFNFKNSLSQNTES